jgi:hypothetical protein
MKEWHPRRPSAGLRSRIFAAEPAAAAYVNQPFDLTALMRWLVPVAGCFVLATATLTHQEIPLGPSEPMGGKSLAFSKAAGHTSMNNVPATTVEWTFGRPSSSNNDSFDRTVTNTLIK